MKTRYVVVAVALLSILVAGSVARAEMTRVTFDARTHVYYDSTGTLMQALQFFIEVYDSEKKHPPSFVTSLNIKAPDGTLINVTPAANWSEIDKGYVVLVDASTFTGAAVPSGNYMLIARSGSVTIRAIDTLNPITFLDPVEITYPTAGATGVLETADFTWTAATPAATTVRYLISLWNKDRDEPVYCNYAGIDPVYTMQTHYTMPKGVLKPNTNYRLMIQTRTNLQDTDARANTKWISFTTGSW